VPSLLEKLDGNASQTSWTWLEVFSKELWDFNNINKIEINMHWCE